MAGVSVYRLNKTAKEIWDAYASGTTVLLRTQYSTYGTIETLCKMESGTVTDANNAEFTTYEFSLQNGYYYAYGDNYYPVSKESVAQNEAGYVDATPES